MTVDPRTRPYRIDPATDALMVRDIREHLEARGITTDHLDDTRFIDAIRAVQDAAVAFGWCGFDPTWTIIDLLSSIAATNSESRSDN